ncbi:MAG: ATP-binding cassette domain-containing protein [Alphaproteobacteria bacterium]|nr:ATP-binding cassette domain-containing protein [Alphaproteobacteria bacterium]
MIRAVRSSSFAIPAAVVAVLAVYALGFASSYDQRLLTLAGVYLILVLGYQFIFGHAGALSLAQGSFFGVGAYTTGILATAWNPGFVVTFPLSILCASLIAGLVAIPVLRLQTHYFALATLALSQLLLLVAVNWEGLTGGANGLAGVPPIEVLGWTASRGLPLLAVVWAIAGTAMLVARWQMGPDRTASFTVAREAPIAAPAFGMDTQMMRFRAFLLSAAFGGAAGALFVHTNRVVSPETLGFGVMVTCLTMTVVGGRYTVLGALIGALLLTHLPEWLRDLDRYYLVALGVLLLVMVVFAPNGLAAFVSRSPSRTAPNSLATAHPADLVRGDVRLVATALSKTYGGIRALDGVSLDLQPGEIVGIIGPNGAGKTTLANVLTGTARAESGTVLVAGIDVTKRNPHEIARLGIARTFQTPQLPSGLSVEDIVETARRHAAVPQPPETNALLSFCGLASIVPIAADTLPHGTRRMVEICRAVAARPGILILDEPAAGLTPKEQLDLGTLCRSLATAGMGILLIDHNIDFLRPITDRLVCMDAGRIVADGPPGETLEDPRVREAYFGLDIQ